LIQTSQLSKRYGAKTALRDLTLTVSPGEVYVLLGPNGAGKTTALRCLAGLLKPTSGHATIDGIDPAVDPLAARGRIGYLTASMGLYERLTPRELLSYFGALHGMEEKLLEGRVAHLMDRFGINDFGERYCGRLSTGQRQRVSIARSVVHDPPALVLDEPTLGLDILSGETMHAFLFEQREEGKAVVLSTHQLDTVDIVADRVGVLADGRLVAEGSIAELLEASGKPNLARAFLHLVAKSRAAERSA
jgi:sodium transport system ATP-binding protein